MMGGSPWFPTRENSVYDIIEANLFLVWTDSTKLHSPREIISTAGKTGHDARWKQKQS